MPKILLRFVALLLIPCLIADPVTASTFLSSTQVPHVSRLSVNQTRFEEQALEMPDEWAEHVERLLAQRPHLASRLRRLVGAQPRPKQMFPSIVQDLWRRVSAPAYIGEQGNARLISAKELWERGVEQALGERRYEFNPKSEPPRMGALEAQSLQLSVEDLMDLLPPLPRGTIITIYENKRNFISIFAQDKDDERSVVSLNLARDWRGSNWEIELGTGNFMAEYFMSYLKTLPDEERHKLRGDSLLGQLYSSSLVTQKIIPWAKKRGVSSIRFQGPAEFAMHCGFEKDVNGWKMILTPQPPAQTAVAPERKTNPTMSASEGNPGRAVDFQEFKESLLAQPVTAFQDMWRTWQKSPSVLKEVGILSTTSLKEAFDLLMKAGASIDVLSVVFTHLLPALNSGVMFHNLAPADLEGFAHYLKNEGFNLVSTSGHKTRIFPKLHWPARNDANDSYVLRKVADKNSVDFEALPEQDALRIIPFRFDNVTNSFEPLLFETDELSKELAAELIRAWQSAMEAHGNWKQHLGIPETVEALSQELNHLYPEGFDIEIRLVDHDYVEIDLRGEHPVIIIPLNRIPGKSAVDPAIMSKRLVADLISEINHLLNPSLDDEALEPESLLIFVAQEGVKMALAIHEPFAMLGSIFAGSVTFALAEMISRHRDVISWDYIQQAEFLRNRRSNGPFYMEQIFSDYLWENLLNRTYVDENGAGVVRKTNPLHNRPPKGPPTVQKPAEMGEANVLLIHWHYDTNRTNTFNANVNHFLRGTFPDTLPTPKKLRWLSRQRDRSPVTGLSVIIKPPLHIIRRIRLEDRAFRKSLPKSLRKYVKLIPEDQLHISLSWMELSPSMIAKVKPIFLDQMRTLAMSVPAFKFQLGPASLLISERREFYGVSELFSDDFANLQNMDFLRDGAGESLNVSPTETQEKIGNIFHITEFKIERPKNKKKLQALQAAFQQYRMETEHRDISIIVDSFQAEQLNGFENRVVVGTFKLRGLSASPGGSAGASLNKLSMGNGLEPDKPDPISLEGRVDRKWRDRIGFRYPTGNLMAPGNVSWGHGKEDDWTRELIKRAQQEAELALDNGQQNIYMAVMEARKLITSLNGWAKDVPEAEKPLNGALSRLATWSSDHYPDEIDRIPLMVWQAWDGQPRRWVVDFYQRWAQHSHVTRYRSIWFLFRHLNDMPAHLLFPALRGVLISLGPHVVLPQLVDALCNADARQRNAAQELSEGPLPRRNDRLQDEIASLDITRAELLSVLLAFAKKESTNCVHELAGALEHAPDAFVAEQTIKPALVTMGQLYPKKVIPALVQELIGIVAERRRLERVYRVSPDKHSKSAEALARRIMTLDLIQDTWSRSLDEIAERGSEHQDVIHTAQHKVLQKASEASNERDSLLNLRRQAFRMGSDPKNVVNYARKLIAVLKNWPEKLLRLDQDPLIEILAGLASKWDAQNGNTIMSLVWKETKRDPSSWILRFFEHLAFEFEDASEVVHFLIVDQKPDESFLPSIRQLLFEIGYRHPEAILDAVVASREKYWGFLPTRRWLMALVLTFISNLAVRSITQKARPGHKDVSVHRVLTSLVNRVELHPPHAHPSAQRMTHPLAVDTRKWISKLLASIAETSPQLCAEIRKILQGRKHSPASILGRLQQFIEKLHIQFNSKLESNAVAPKLLGKNPDGFILHGGKSVAEFAARKEEFKMHPANDIVQKYQAALNRRMDEAKKWVADSRTIDFAKKQLAEGHFYGFPAIVKALDEFLLGLNLPEDQAVFLATDLIQFLESRGPPSLVEEYLFHELLCPLIGHNAAILLAQDVFPQHYQNSTQLTFQTSDKPYKGLLGEALRAFINRQAAAVWQPSEPATPSAIARMALSKPESAKKTIENNVHEFLKQGNGASAVAYLQEVLEALTVVQRSTINEIYNVADVEAYVLEELARQNPKSVNNVVFGTPQIIRGFPVYPGGAAGSAPKPIGPPDDESKSFEENPFKRVVTAALFQAGQKFKNITGHVPALIALGGILPFTQPLPLLEGELSIMWPSLLPKLFIHQLISMQDRPDPKLTFVTWNDEGKNFLRFSDNGNGKAFESSDWEPIERQVRAYGGKITAFYEPDEGASYILSFPESSSPKDPDVAAPGKPKISGVATGKSAPWSGRLFALAQQGGAAFDEAFDRGEFDKLDRDYLAIYLLASEARDNHQLLPRLVADLGKDVVPEKEGETYLEPIIWEVFEVAAQHIKDRVFMNEEESALWVSRRMTSAFAQWVDDHPEVYPFEEPKRIATEEDKTYVQGRLTEWTEEFVEQLCLVLQGKGNSVWDAYHNSTINHARHNATLQPGQVYAVAMRDKQSPNVVPDVISAELRQALSKVRSIYYPASGFGDIAEIHAESNALDLIQDLFPGVEKIVATDQNAPSIFLQFIEHFAKSLNKVWLQQDVAHFALQSGEGEPGTVAVLVRNPILVSDTSLSADLSVSGEIYRSVVPKMRVGDLLVVNDAALPQSGASLETLGLEMTGESGDRVIKDNLVRVTRARNSWVMYRKVKDGMVQSAPAAAPTGSASSSVNFPELRTYPKGSPQYHASRARVINELHLHATRESEAIINHWNDLENSVQSPLTEDPPNPGDWTVVLDALMDIVNRGNVSLEFLSMCIEDFLQYASLANSLLARIHDASGPLGLKIMNLSRLRDKLRRKLIARTPQPHLTDSNLAATSITSPNADLEKHHGLLAQFAPLEEALRDLGFGPGKLALSIGPHYPEIVLGDDIVPWELLLLHLGAAIKIFQPEEHIHAKWEAYRTHRHLEVVPLDKARFNAESQPLQSADAVFLMSVITDPETGKRSERETLFLQALQTLRKDGLFFLGWYPNEKIEITRLNHAIKVAENAGYRFIPLTNSQLFVEKMHQTNPWVCFRIRTKPLADALESNEHGSFGTINIVWEAWQNLGKAFRHLRGQMAGHRMLNEVGRGTAQEAQVSRPPVQVNGPRMIPYEERFSILESIDSDLRSAVSVFLNDADFASLGMRITLKHNEPYAPNRPADWVDITVLDPFKHEMVTGFKITKINEGAPSHTNYKIQTIQGDIHSFIYLPDPQFFTIIPAHLEGIARVALKTLKSQRFWTTWVEEAASTAGASASATAAPALEEQESGTAPGKPSINAKMLTRDMDGVEDWHQYNRHLDFVTGPLQRLQNAINRDDSKAGKQDPLPAEPTRNALLRRLKTCKISVMNEWRLYVDPINLPEVPWVMDRVRDPETAPVHENLRDLRQLLLEYPLEILPRLSRTEPGFMSEGVYLSFVKGIAHPVAIKVFDSKDIQKIQREIVFAQVLDRLGLGPRFYGVVEFPDGKVGYVMQLMSGSRSHYNEMLPSPDISLETADLRHRAKAMGLEPLDFVLSRTNHVLCIDAGSVIIWDDQKYKAFLVLQNLSLNPDRQPKTPTAAPHRNSAFPEPERKKLIREYVFKDLKEFEPVRHKKIKEVFPGERFLPGLPIDPRFTYRGMNLTLGGLQHILRRGMELSKVRMGHVGILMNDVPRDALMAGMISSQAYRAPQKNFISIVFQMDRGKIPIAHQEGNVLITRNDILPDRIFRIVALRRDAALVDITSLLELPSITSPVPASKKSEKGVFVLEWSLALSIAIGLLGKVLKTPASFTYITPALILSGLTWVVVKYSRAFRQQSPALLSAA